MTPLTATGNPWNKPVITFPDLESSTRPLPSALFGAQIHVKTAEAKPVDWTLRVFQSCILLITWEISQLALRGLNPLLL